MNQYAVFIGQSPYFNYKEFMKELIDATKIKRNRSQNQQNGDARNIIRLFLLN